MAGRPHSTDRHGAMKKGGKAMSVREKPHYTISSAALAQWIDNQPDKWWMVDGDPYLTGRVDFPCPSDELVEALRKRPKKLLLQDIHQAVSARGQEIGA